MHKMRTLPLPETADVAAAAVDALRTARSMSTGDEMRDATAVSAIAPRESSPRCCIATAALQPADGRTDRFAPSFASLP